MRLEARSPNCFSSTYVLDQSDLILVGLIYHTILKIKQVELQERFLVHFVLVFKI